MAKSNKGRVLLCSGKGGVEVEKVKELSPLWKRWTKRSSQAFNNHDFLPEDFSATLKSMRKFSWNKRPKRLGISK